MVLSILLQQEPLPNFWNTVLNQSPLVIFETIALWLLIKYLLNFKKQFDTYLANDREKNNEILSNCHTALSNSNEALKNNTKALEKFIEKVDSVHH